MPLLLLQMKVEAAHFVIGSLNNGQLGNQCFQIATTLSHAWDHGAIPVFPDLKSSQRFDIPINYEKVFWRLDDTTPGSPVKYFYLEPHYHYSPIPYYPNMKIRGFFQSEKYFRKYKEKICTLFAPSEEILSYLSTKYSAILTHPNTVSLHIRVYFRREDPSHIHSFNGPEYLKKAVSHFPKDALFVVFSNDMGWCKEHLKNLAKEMVFVEGEAHYHDFYLMSLCKHNIISNSSFSWWAAYLNKNPNKVVVAPQKWLNEGSGLDYKDVIPEEWVTIP